MRYDVIIRKQDNTPIKIETLYNRVDVTIKTWEYKMQGYKCDVVISEK